MLIMEIGGHPIDIDGQNIQIVHTPHQEFKHFGKWVTFVVTVGRQDLSYLQSTKVHTRFEGEIGCSPDILIADRDWRKDNC